MGMIFSGVVSRVVPGMGMFVDYSNGSNQFKGYLPFWYAKRNAQPFYPNQTVNVEEVWSEEHQRFILEQV